MDPLSITASVIAVATLAAQTAQAAYRTIDGLIDAPQAIAHSKTLLSGTQNSLEILTETLEKNEHMQAQFGGILQSIALEKTLQATNELCKGFSAIITKYTSRSTDSKFSNRDRLSITFHESRILTFNGELSDCQRTIHLMTGTITLIVSNDTSKDVRQLSSRFQAQEQALSSLSTELSTRSATTDVLPRTTEDNMREGDTENNQGSLERTTALQESNQAALKALQQKRIGQTFGDLHTDQSMAMQGIVGEAQQGVDQSFGKLNAINNSRAFQGQMDAGSFAQMFK
ncbi:hypothetical protein PFICI_11740 [Pestalotiopsis fici W106-1]|uniref:Azaphilone pigments biosynthesis cluster protein L N-terminal domain-containing protein n=1 Tax=Pestalotiopsis fici (strain W106-1 / CGMCC3.15140) TaxID=1229662 RepID=W3WR85_PESFW|nr:uncharacterized protein PFICI_11740 [Pestalotiopsis fici W106-1]ETS76353.1 hypothetical protein PFICI_11740 [Pestalotiopsis fici W106-1]